MLQSPLVYRILGVLAPATRSHQSPAACDAAIPLVVERLLHPDVSRLYAGLPAPLEQILDAGEVGRPLWKETTIARTNPRWYRRCDSWIVSPVSTSPTCLPRRMSVLGPSG